MENSTTNLNQALRDTAKAGIDATREAGGKALNAVEETLSGARQTARERYHAMQDMACDCVTRHPGKTIASVAIFSLVLGMLLGGRRPRRE